MGRRGEKGAKDKVTKGIREWNRGRGLGVLIQRGRAVYLAICAAWAPEFLVMPLLMGRSAYVARAGFQTQSAPARGVYRYHVGHRCRDVERSCKEFRSVIDSTVTSVHDSLDSCRQALNAIELDEQQFAADMFQTTEQAVANSGRGGRWGAPPLLASDFFRLFPYITHVVCIYDK